jgi:hypothetical protein
MLAAFRQTIMFASFLNATLQFHSKASRPAHHSRPGAVKKGAWRLDVTMNEHLQFEEHFELYPLGVLDGEDKAAAEAHLVLLC